MPHSPELIQTILVLVERDYPPDRHRYAIEKFLPGTRMAPDIAVFSPQGETLCVIEIGYTRPEKLTAYRHTHRIADVRWYDKSGILHGDIQEKSVRMTVTYDVDMDVTVYTTLGIVPCLASDCFDEAALDGMDTEEIDEAFDSAAAEVMSAIITDDERAWIFNFCDKCGEAWISSNETEDAEIGILDELREGTGHSHFKMWGKRERMAWTQAAQVVKENFNTDLVYEDGFWLFPQSRKQFSRNIVKYSR